MADTPGTLRIDGSVLEGGGQLLRISVALAALLSRPITIYNIRGKRTPPGLKNQHVAGLRLVAEICGGGLDGCNVGATTISFSPSSKPQCARSYRADPQTAGSVALLLQVSLPCLFWSPPPPPPPAAAAATATAAPSTLALRGGTNAIQAPQIDYTQAVFMPFIRTHFGLDFSIQVLKRGYFPKGGGAVRCTIPAVSAALPAVTLTARGAVTAVRGVSYVAGLPKSLAESMHAAAIDALVDWGLERSQIDVDVVRYSPRDAVGAGSGIVLWAETDKGCILGGSALGKKGVDFSLVGSAAAKELTRNLDHGGCVDEYMQDQMIIFMALAKGKSMVNTGPLTLHTRSAIWVVEQLTTAKFTVQEGKTITTIECEGIGYVPAPTI